jgi:Tol biopolymer transport system component/C-terminal processing protease CtpA/Prc
MHRPLLICALFAALLAQARPEPAPAPAFAEPGLSSDGSEIAFVSGGDIWTVPATGGDARLLVSNAANETRPMYSPDRKHLAFVSTRTGGGDVYVLTLATGDVRRMTFDDGLDQLDGWSRDGRYLYFSSSAHDLAGGVNDVYRVSLDGGTPMAVSADRYANEFFSAVSPDGKTLAMSARGIASGQWWRHGRSHIDEAEIWLRDLTAPDSPAAYRAITSGGSKDLWPMWAADGESLFFVSDRNGPENIWQTGTAAGSKPRPVTSFKSGRVLWPSISARGDVIVFERNFQIWKLDTASGKAAAVPIARIGAPAGPSTEQLRLTNQFTNLALSPDGKKVAFAARGEIFAASAKDGGDAARVTMTAAPESQPAWSPDSRRIVYSSERSGPARLVSYDFTSSKETVLTSEGAGDDAPRFSPDGKSIAFVRGGGELRVLDVASGKDRVLAKGIIADPIQVGRPIAWSPDGRWLAFFTAGTRGFTNVSVVPLAGGEARPVSFLANANATSVAWAPDGTFLLFDTGQRTEVSQLARVDLTLRTPRFREDQFRELFNEEQGPRRPASPPATPPADVDSPKPPSTSPHTSPPATADDKKTEEANPGDKKPVPPTQIVFDDIRHRLSLIPAGLDVSEAFISPDGKTVVMIAGAAGQQNLYSWSMDETARERPVARQLTTTAGGKADVSFSPDSKEVFYLDDGRINAVTLERRETRAVSVTAEMSVDFAKEKLVVFDQAWRLLRDNFFDAAFNGVDWNEARAAVEPYIAGARTPDEMRRITSLMIGELNASHLGINPPPAGGGASGVGHLGLDFERAAYESSGALKIAAIVPLGPAALGSGIERGQFLIAIDGEAIGPRVNLDALLENKVNRRTVLRIARTAAGEGGRDVPVRPVSAVTERGLRYRQWVAERRAYVARASNNRLGYVHMPDMSAGSLAQLYVDLDADNIAREGVVIDIRNNNGGFVNPYALDVFGRAHYLNMTVRGMPTAPARSALGQRSLEKPTVLITNQHSLSDAEDFTEGYRAMKLGKVVGEPTAGWIIFTWNTRLMDGTVLRLPRSRITDRNGAPMEMHPRPVDVEVKRPIGESYGAKDSQIDRAVAVLLDQITSRRPRRRRTRPDPCASRYRRCRYRPWHRANANPRPRRTGSTPGAA